MQQTPFLLCFSELKDLVEKQSDLILDLNCKLEECSQNLKETNSELENCKLENLTLKVSLAQQNTKFEKIFESLEMEGNSIKNTMSRQKVDIEGLDSRFEKHDEALVNIRELIKEEKNINKSESSNQMNLFKTLDAKVEDNKKSFDEYLASSQVHMANMALALTFE